MKIVILQGSPNVSGSTAMLVDNFMSGAQKVGHECKRVDVDKLDFEPCTGCVACGYEGPCSQSDDFDDLRELILASDMVVFATPLYYFGMTAQLKAVVDRFCSANASITAGRKKCALLAVAWNTQDWIYDALVSHYKTFTRYLKMSDQGMILGRGCGTPTQTAGSDFPRKAYEFGKSL